MGVWNHVSILHFSSDIEQQALHRANFTDVIVRSEFDVYFEFQVNAPCLKFWLSLIANCYI